MCLVTADVMLSAMGRSGWRVADSVASLKAALREHFNSRRNNDVRQFRFISTTNYLMGGVGRRVRRAGGSVA